VVKDRRIFNTQTDAIGFLVDEGYVSNKSNFSRHVREGKVGKSVDGVFEAESLLSYAALNVKRTDSGKTLSREDKDRASAKAEAELNLIQEKYKRERIKRLKEEKKLIDRNKVEIEFGARAGILSSLFKSEIQKGGRELVELVEGKPSKTGDLIQALIDMFDKMATEYASMKNIEAVLSDESGM